MPSLPLPLSSALDGIMEILQLFFFTWLLYLFGAIVPFVVYAIKRVKKEVVPKLEQCVLIVPFILWWSFALINFMPKTLSNLGESLTLGAVVSGLYFLRLALGKFIKYPSQIYFVASCFASILIYCLVPELPE